VIAKKGNRKGVQMAKFLCIQRGLPGGVAGGAPSPEQMQQMYAAFQAWQSKFGTSIVDMGGRLGEGRLVASSPKIDGSFVEIKELIGGYMIVSANSLDEASKIAEGCPGLVGPGSGVEVIEILAP
jgi:hypothetical protein